MNTQTDAHPVIFRTHTGTYVHMFTRPHACTLQMCLHVRTHSQPSLNIEVKSKKLEIRYVTDMFIDNRLTCMHYHSDGSRQDRRTFGRTNEWKENIQTNRVTNNITQKYAYRRTDGHTDGRTHIQIIFGLVDRQTDRNIHKTV